MKRDIAEPNQPSFRENGRYIARRIVPAASSLQRFSTRRISAEWHSVRPALDSEPFSLADCRAA